MGDGGDGGLNSACVKRGTGRYAARLRAATYLLSMGGEAGGRVAHLGVAMRQVKTIALRGPSIVTIGRS
jgi:hypothetical protein